MHRIFACFILWLCCNLAFSLTKEIAITIDDLPLVGSGQLTEAQIRRTHDRFMRILQALIKHKAEATGFIIAAHISDDQWELLESFKNAGFSLGNHTYSHESLDSMSAEEYMHDIAKADRILSPVLTLPKYFRYPYLAESDGDKRLQVHKFLSSLNYHIAPVTIDSKDYVFNEKLYKIPYQQRKELLPGLINRYLAYIEKQIYLAEQNTQAEEPIRQILLIHANLLNSYALDAVLSLLENMGYRFIPLAQAVD
ncbi:MAG: hypothetical protein A3F18_08535 [Legionellales bacterium RIFCSPHIGHO2_12_FULL_37_14]|nr:MAG: hypothetical protein A3F18_08535 [Legionellales bacterium RIFCSPHIGHO2_12_FULL_37_14]